MPIRRGSHSFDEQFTQIPNAWLRDPNLTLKAVGLLAQLHSHRVGWLTSIHQLAKQNSCGRDQIRSAVHELERNGYLIRVQPRDDSNRFQESEWITAEPSSGFPSSGFPATENRPTKKTNVKNTNEKKENNNELFDEFWEAYPRKVGRASALKAFEKTEQALAVAGARRLKYDPNLPDVQFIPYPSTWLNRRGWEDDPYPERTDKEAIDRQKAIEAEERKKKERETTREYLQEMEELAKKASLPKPCEHGSNPALCNKCLNSLSKSNKGE